MLLHNSVALQETPMLSYSYAVGISLPSGQKSKSKPRCGRCVGCQSNWRRPIHKLVWSTSHTLRTVHDSVPSFDTQLITSRADAIVSRVGLATRFAYPLMEDVL